MINDFTELGKLNEIDRANETLGDEDFDPYLKKKATKIVKDNKKIKRLEEKQRHER